jgi:hypothetical protein
MRIRKEVIKNSFLGQNAPILELSVLVGVQPESVKLEGNRITGYWADVSQELVDVNSPPLCERFVNWPETAEKIVAFTRKYGPLLQRPRFTPEGRGCAFSFTLDEWRVNQDRIREQWILGGLTPPGMPDELDTALKHSLAQGTLVDCGTAVTIQQDEILQFLPGKASLRVNTLFRFIQLEVCACPRQHLKVCRFCKTCFVEPDKRVVYCGKLTCRVQGKNESNRVAWHRNKAKWTKKHRSSD